MYFKPVTEVAAKHFGQCLEEFLAACPRWTRASVLRSAKMDPGLIRRVERGKPFNTATLDRLLEFMEQVVSLSESMKPAPVAKVRRIGVGARKKKKAGRDERQHARPGRSGQRRAAHEAAR